MRPGVTSPPPSPCSLGESPPSPPALPPRGDRAAAAAATLLVRAFRRGAGVPIRSERLSVCFSRRMDRVAVCPIGPSGLSEGIGLLVLPAWRRATDSFDIFRHREARKPPCLRRGSNLSGGISRQVKTNSLRRARVDGQDACQSSSAPSFLSWSINAVRQGQCPSILARAQRSPQLSSLLVRSAYACRLHTNRPSW